MKKLLLLLLFCSAAYGSVTTDPRATGAASGVILGVNTNSAACAGCVGEVITGTRLVGSPLSLSSTVSADITSVSLTAGDWDCNGVVNIITAATTSISLGLRVGTTTTSGAIDADNTFTTDNRAAYAPGVATTRFNVPTRRMLIATTTPLYLEINTGFNVDVLTAFGTLWCRRMR